MIKGLKSKITISVKNGKFNVFLLFLCLALVILLLSKLTRQHTKTITFNISPVNLPQELVLLNNDSLLMDITIKAQGYKLLGYYIEKPHIDMDFSNLNKLNDSIYYWDRTTGFLQLEDKLKNIGEVIMAKPEKLFFHYDVNSISKVPVRLNTKIDFAKGFDLSGQFNLVPDSVTVIGPKSIISQIKSVNTDTLVLHNVNMNFSKKIHLSITEDFQKIKVSDNSIEVSGFVEKFSEGSLKVPIIIKNVPDNLQISTFPKEAIVTFYTSLSNFKNVQGKDFIVECDYSRVTSEAQYLKPYLVKKPDIVKGARINQERIEFILN